MRLSKGEVVNQKDTKGKQIRRVVRDGVLYSVRWLVKAPDYCQWWQRGYFLVWQLVHLVVWVAWLWIGY